MTEKLFKRSGQTWSLALIGLVLVSVAIVQDKMQIVEAKTGNETSPGFLSNAHSVPG